MTADNFTHRSVKPDVSKADEYEPVFAEIVIVGHARRRMSRRPVGHTGHARDPGARGVRAVLLLFFFSLRRQRQSCAQLYSVGQKTGAGG